MTDLRTRLDELHTARRDFGPGAGARKLRRLQRAADLPICAARDLLRYHDLLLFMAAHPDDARIARAVAMELERVASGVARLARPDACADSGVAGTTVESPFSCAALRALLRRFPGSVDIAWSEGSAGTGLGGLLALTTCRVESDGYVGAGLSDEDWLRAARGGRPSDLAWLLDRVEAAALSAEARDQVFDAAEIPVRWHLDPPASRTFARFPARRLSAQRKALQRTVDVRRELRRPLPPPRALTRTERAELLTTVRCALLARARETDPVTYANPREVILFDLGRGIDIALIGMQPDRRLPIESFFGYMLARNRVPMAYGGAWVFFDRAEIGVNIFEEYRGGESAYVFAQVMRLYRQQFGVRRFLVDPYQFGADNPEAIRTGAYWFYDHLGFRPIEPKAQALADTERALRRAHTEHRTSAARLRALARSPIALDLETPGPIPDVHAIAMAVTRDIESRFGGDRRRAVAVACRRLDRVLPARRSTWTGAERQAFADLAPLCAMIPALDHWSEPQRRALAGVMRAKGGPQERAYVSRVQRHPRLRAALCALAETGSRQNDDRHRFVAKR